MTKELSYVMLEPHNVRMKPLNVRKKLSHVMLELHNMRMELSNVRKKNKRITECDKSTVTCGVGIAQCVDSTIKCEKK